MLLDPLYWTQMSVSRSMYIECSKKTKAQLVAFYGQLDSNGLIVLSLLNFVINCEQSKLYSNHILVAIVLKSFFKHGCDALTRYIIYLIDKHFDLINLKTKTFDVNIQYGFWSGGDDD